MTSVQIYTTRYCPYCRWAKDLLQRKGVTFEEFDIGSDEDMRTRMIKRANGRSAVPQIFIGSNHIGGCDDLYALDQSGKLDTLLAGANRRTA